MKTRMVNLVSSLVRLLYIPLLSCYVIDIVTVDAVSVQVDDECTCAECIVPMKKDLTGKCSCFVCVHDDKKAIAVS